MAESKEDLLGEMTRGIGGVETREATDVYK